MAMLGCVRRSRFEIFPIQMNLSEIGPTHLSPAKTARLSQDPGGYMSGKGVKQ